MKGTKVLVLLMALFFSAAAARGMEITGIDRDDISLKAGPTAPGEGLSMVWLEALVYPRVVKSDRVVSLGVRLTSKVDKVEVSFDFSKDKVELDSENGLYFSGAYQIPEGAAPGLHVARYSIIGKNGSIQRTVEFFLDKTAMSSGREGVSQGEVYAAQGWPLTVAATTSALVEGSARVLYAGQKVIGLSKVAWYKVIFEDGQIGFVSAGKVREPIDDYIKMGKNAFNNRKYSSAVAYFKDVTAIDPRSVSGHYWLARTYEKQGNIEAAYRAVKKAMEIDERDMESKVLADNLAKIYYAVASRKMSEGRLHEAITAYQKILDLKPSSVASWIELGKCYSKLKMEREARSAWGEALRNDPDNRTVMGLLDLSVGRPMMAAEPKKEAVAAVPAKPAQIAAQPVKIAETPAPKKVAESMPKPSQEVPALLADDSLLIVKSGKTQKGTSIESALKSVIALTKSLGTPIAEKGWEIKDRGQKFLVRYLCEQGQGAMEAFEWVVDVDTRHVAAYNDNARLLMTRW